MNLESRVKALNALARHEKIKYSIVSVKNHQHAQSRDVVGQFYGERLVGIA